MLGSFVFRPADDCTLRSARDVKASLEGALSAADELVLDCSGIKRADLSFVQLIASAHRTARRDGKVLRLSNMSEAVRSAFARAGLPDADPISANPSLAVA